MKSEVMVINFGESLNNKSGLGFFYIGSGSAFFYVPTRALWAKAAILRGQKLALPVLVRKIRDHCYHINLPKKKGIRHLISLFFHFRVHFFCVENFHF